MSNPENIQFNSEPVFLSDCGFQDVTLNAPGEVTYERGTVLAFDGSDGKYKVTDSTTAAVANAKAVLAEQAVFTGAGDRLSRVLVKGNVDENKLIWQGTDTADTIPAGGSDSFRLQLRDYMIVLKSPASLQEVT